MKKLRMFLATTIFFLALVFLVVGLLCVTPLLLLSAVIAHGPAKVKVAWVEAGRDVDDKLGGNE